MKRIACVFFVSIATALVFTPAAHCEQWKRYTDSTGYQISYPSSWSVKPHPKDAATVRVTPPHTDDFHITIRTVKKNDANKSSLNTFVDQVCVPVIKKMPNVEILEKWQDVINGRRVRTILYIINGAEKQRFKAFIMSGDSRYYWLAYGGKDSSFVDYSDQADKVFATFEPKS